MPEHHAEDVSVAGPAMFAELRRLVTERDAGAIWDLLSDDMRAKAYREADRDLARAKDSARAARKLQEKLELDESPVELDVDELCEAILQRELDRVTDFTGSFGETFLRAERRGDVMIVVTALPEENAEERPNGVVELVFVREHDRWAVDKERQRQVRGRWVRDIDIGTEMDGEAGLTFTPDGSQVVIYGRRGVFLVPFVADASSPPIHLPVAHVNQVALDPAGTWIATSARGGPLPAPIRGMRPSEAPRADRRPDGSDPYGGVMLWRLPSGEPERRLVADCGHLAASPGGTHLLLVDGEDHRGAWLWNVASGESQPVTDASLRPAGGFLTDDRVVLRDRAGDVHMIDTAGRTWWTHDASARGWDLALHPGTSRIAIGSQGAETHILDATTGGLVQTIARGRIAGNAFSPDGTQIVMRHPVARCDVATGALRRIHEAQGYEEAAAFHPEGRWLVVLARAFPTRGEADPGDRLHVFDAIE
jgi:hypothetical protein